VAAPTSEVPRRPGLLEPTGTLHRRRDSGTDAAQALLPTALLVTSLAVGGVEKGARDAGTVEGKAAVLVAARAAVGEQLGGQYGGRRVGFEGAQGAGLLAPPRGVELTGPLVEGDGEGAVGRYALPHHGEVGETATGNRPRIVAGTAHGDHAARPTERHDGAGDVDGPEGTIEHQLGEDGTATGRNLIAGADKSVMAGRGRDIAGDAPAVPERDAKGEAGGEVAATAIPFIGPCLLDGCVRVSVR
jgi:hypothetical protein